MFCNRCHQLISVSTSNVPLHHPRCHTRWISDEPRIQDLYFTPYLFFLITKFLCLAPHHDITFIHWNMGKKYWSVGGRKNTPLYPLISTLRGWGEGDRVRFECGWRVNPNITVREGEGWIQLFMCCLSRKVTHEFGVRSTWFLMPAFVVCRWKHC